MFEHNPCVGCEYYNEPYWSVISPCNHCARIYGVNSYIDTTVNVISSNAGKVVTYKILAGD